MNVHDKLIKSLPLGASVQVDTTLLRRKKYHGNGLSACTWIEYTPSKPITGILVGIRTLVNGAMHYNYSEYEDNHYFEPQSRLSAALVAFQRNRSIVRAPLHAVIPLIQGMPVNVFQNSKGYIAHFEDEKYNRVHVFGKTPIRAYEELCIAVNPLYTSDYYVSEDTHGN